MDKASAYGAGDCRFESCRGHFATRNGQFPASSAMARRAKPPSIVGDQLRALCGRRLLVKVLAHASDPPKRKTIDMLRHTNGFGTRSGASLCERIAAKRSIAQGSNPRKSKRMLRPSGLCFPCAFSGGGSFEKCARRRRCQFFSDSSQWLQGARTAAIRRVASSFWVFLLFWLRGACGSSLSSPSQKDIFWNSRSD